MTSDIYWIDSHDPPRLAIMARPRAGDWLEDEIDNWANQGIQLVVSLLEPEEVSDLELQHEAELCAARGIDFVSFPIPDRGVPEDRRATERLARTIGETNKAVAIHCRVGIGRSSLMAAAVLTVGGMKPDAAFELIQTARGVAVPDTDVQRAWVADFSERLGPIGYRSDT